MDAVDNTMYIHVWTTPISCPSIVILLEQCLIWGVASVGLSRFEPPLCLPKWAWLGFGSLSNRLILSLGLYTRNIIRGDLTSHNVYTCGIAFVVGPHLT